MPLPCFGMGSKLVRHVPHRLAIFFASLSLHSRQSRVGQPLPLAAQKTRHNRTAPGPAEHGCDFFVFFVQSPTLEWRTRHQQRSGRARGECVCDAFRPRRCSVSVPAGHRPYCSSSHACDRDISLYTTHVAFWRSPLFPWDPQYGL